MTNEIIIRSTEIKMVPIAELKLNPNNRNKHPKEQIDQLCKIIQYQGFRRPISISTRSGYVSCGEGRVLAAKKLKMKELPAILQDYESEDQEYADGIADNAIDKQAELDFSMINMDIGNLGPDFDIDWLGLKDFQIDVADKEGLTDEDEIPEQVEPKAKLGDIYQLGEHRLMCGDSTSIDAVERLMNGEKADMVFTDPPYGYNYESNYQNKHKVLENDDKILDFMPMAFGAMSDNSTIYVFGSHQTIDLWKPLFEKNFKYKNMIVWQKNNWSMGSLKDSFAGQHELLLFGIKGKVEIIGKRDSDVWKFDREPPTEHPTIKPIQLIEFALSKFQSGKVLDLFGNSGSTLIACEKTNRKCFMMELDPHYIDVIITRWENFSGKKAILLSSPAHTLDTPLT